MNEEDFQTNCQDFEDKMSLVLKEWVKGKTDEEGKVDFWYMACVMTVLRCLLAKMMVCTCKPDKLPKALEEHEVRFRECIKEMQEIQDEEDDV